MDHECGTSVNSVDKTDKDKSTNNSCCDEEESDSSAEWGKRKNIAEKKKRPKRQGNRGRSSKSSEAAPSFIDEELQKLYEELSDNEEAQCVPNGHKAIECFICGEQLTKIYKLRQHMQLHTHSELFDAKRLEASVIFDTLNPQKRNIETKVIQDFLIGEIQAKRYSQFYGILNEAGLELHISDSETDSDFEQNYPTDLKQIPRNSYKCDLCDIRFDRRYKALFHQRTTHSHGDLYIECEFCGRRYIGIELLIHHLKTQCESDEKPIACVERFKQYLLKVNIEQFENLAQARKDLKMQRLTTAPKVYTCNVCQKTFTRSEHLSRHKAVHLPEELKFECPVCFRRFNRKDNMRSHMKVHMDEAEKDNSTTQPILCQYCGHCFTSKSNYVVHMRRHTGEKPYKCDQCGKGFPKSTDLNSHKITHSGEKNFKCNICNKAFARSAVLSKHMRVHAGPFHCNLCEQSFPRPNELANHLRTHVSGGRVCTCIVCYSNFNTQKDLEEHFQSTGHDNIRTAPSGQQKPTLESNDESTSSTFRTSYVQTPELLINQSSVLEQRKEAPVIAPLQNTSNIHTDLSLRQDSLLPDICMADGNVLLQSQPPNPIYNWQ